MKAHKSQSDVYARVSKNIRKRIAASDMSQNEVSKRLGITPGNFSVQLRKGTMRIGRLAELASILGCEISDFFGE